MSFREVARLIDNAVSYADEKPYAAIIGVNPSKGARSPKLWNAAFRSIGIDAQMIPMDVTPEKIPSLLQILEDDSNFLGGAVAVPYKGLVADYIRDRASLSDTKIGSINCLYRDDDGALCGANTDGEAALRTFELKFGPVLGKTALVLGPGGTGRAVASQFQKGVGTDGHMCVAGRSDIGKRFAELIGAEWVQWSKLPEILPRVDLLVNCTTLGDERHNTSSPISKEHLTRLPNHAVVFDVIYQPSPTVLLQHARERGLSSYGGSDMNLEQAVIAFTYAVRLLESHEKIRQAMDDARKM